MPPGGFYTDFLHRFVPFGVAKQMARRMLVAAKQWAIDVQLILCCQLCRQMLSTEAQPAEYALPAAVCISQFLMGADLTWCVMAENLHGSLHVKPKIHEKNAAWLRVASPLVLQSVARACLDPLWRQYAAEASPGRRRTSNGPVEPCTVEDYESSLLPTRCVDMAAKKIASFRCLKVLRGLKSPWKDETRSGNEIEDDEPFSLHTNGRAAEKTADGGMSVCANTILHYSGRIHFLMGRAFPAAPNPNESDLVKTALASVRRIVGTAQPCEADALWDEVSTRLFSLLDVHFPRDLQCAAASSIGEHAGWRANDVYLLDRHDIQFDTDGVRLKLPRHKGDQESSMSSSKVEHNNKCALRNVHGWEHTVSPSTALPCAMNRWGARDSRLND